MSGVWIFFFFAVGVHKYCQMQSQDARGKEFLLCLGLTDIHTHIHPAIVKHPRASIKNAISNFPVISLLSGSFFLYFICLTASTTDALNER